MDEDELYYDEDELDHMRRETLDKPFVVTKELAAVYVTETMYYRSVAANPCEHCARRRFKITHDQLLTTPYMHSLIMKCKECGHVQRTFYVNGCPTLLHRLPELE